MLKCCGETAAGQGRAGQGRAGQGRAGQGKMGLKRAGQRGKDRATQGRVGCERLASMAADCVGSYCFLMKSRKAGVLASQGHMRRMASWLVPMSASS